MTQTQKFAPKCDSLSRQGLSQTEKLTDDQSPKSSPTSLAALSSATSFAEYWDGVSPFSSQGGPQTGQSGQAPVPVSRSALQEKVSAPMTSDTSGPPSSASSASVALTQSLVSKLKARFDTVGSMEYVETWKEKATPSGMSYWAHTASVPRTSVKDCSGWPTASARDWKDSPGMAVTAVNPDGSTRLRLDQLPRVAQLAPWPTCSAVQAPNMSTNRGSAHGGRRPRQTAQSVEGIMAGWATPDASVANSGESLESWNSRQVKNKAKHKNGNGAGMPLAVQTQMVSGLTLSGSDAWMGSTAGFHLNPFFSLWLQGFPTAWGMACLSGLEKYSRQRKASRSPRSSRTGKKCSKEQATPSSHK